MGRFINRDPVDEQGGLNLYAFVTNNAVNRYDLLGMVRDGEVIMYDGGEGGTNSIAATLTGHVQAWIDERRQGTAFDDSALWNGTTDLDNGMAHRAAAAAAKRDEARLEAAQAKLNAGQSVTLTDSNGNSQTFNPGDTIFSASGRVGAIEAATENSVADYGFRRGDRMPAPDKFDDPRTYRYAKAWVLQDGKNVNIYVPVIYRGPTATAENITRFESGVKKYWEGTIGSYEVSVTFMPGPVDRGLKFGTIIYMADAGQSRSWYYGAEGWGLIAYNTEGARDRTAGHEFGHFMGSRLHYDLPGAEDYPNNIMINPDGAVEPINIEEAIQRWGGFKSKGFKP